jgi:hypothetical protein
MRREVEGLSSRGSERATVGKGAARCAFAGASSVGEKGALRHACRMGRRYGKREESERELIFRGNDALSGRVSRSGSGLSLPPEERVR